MAKIMSALISMPSGVVAASTIGVAVGITSTVTTGFMPVLMDVIFDVSGSYDIAIIVILTGMLIGTAIIARLPIFDVLTR